MGRLDPPHLKNLWRDSWQPSQPAPRKKCVKQASVWLCLINAQTGHVQSWYGICPIERLIVH